MSILLLFCITSYCLLASECVLCSVSGCTSRSDPGTFECMQMLPKLVRNSYSVQANCVTERGVCCPSLSLFVPSG